ncbi:BZ3500_MvSof-1268-A1-R1_Chr3-1g06048 [Microbotryum saponariae]|uniref:BZ3500_MvSof-1268-A1-R1_Chr3-1g06048 protein n=1 Tax=Microbotryum saponariae TaxID=289078 RepID=A0A2X0L252_9BASI|nr:BZ3500_MvSof-1268-A1-R1_Chr3-1g06048 [Microbotryum saponariae]SDA03863.1 BZ3501_MvSof-1269-A2-R1_Chr3-2g05733 [Microbotryum saponariae]
MATSSYTDRKAEALQAARTLRTLKFACSCELASTLASNKRRLLARERAIIRPNDPQSQFELPPKRRESIGPIRTTCTSAPYDRKPLQAPAELKPSVLEHAPSTPSSLGPVRTQSKSNRTVEGVVHVGRQVYIVERATKVTISTVRRVVSVPPVGTREWEVLKPYLVPRRQEKGDGMTGTGEGAIKTEVKVEGECEMKDRTGVERDAKVRLGTLHRRAAQAAHPFIPSHLTFRFPDPSAHTQRQHWTRAPPLHAPTPLRRSSLASAYERFLRETIPIPRDFQQHRTNPSVAQRAPLCWRRGKRIRPLTLF